MCFSKKSVNPWDKPKENTESKRGKTRETHDLASLKLSHRNREGTMSDCEGENEGEYKRQTKKGGKKKEEEIMSDASLSTNIHQTTANSSTCKAQPYSCELLISI